MLDRASHRIASPITQHSEGGMLEVIAVNSHASKVRTVEVPTTTIRQLADQHSVWDFALVSDIEDAETGFILAEPEDLARCQQLPGAPGRTRPTPR